MNTLSKALRRFWPFFLTAFFFLFSLDRPAIAAQPGDLTSVLIIGHSWTSKSAEHLNTLTAGLGDFFAGQVIHGGYSLKNQWNDPEQMAQIRAELESGAYQYAAIMDFAGLVADLEETGGHRYHAGLFADLFASYGVRTVLLLPWAYVEFPQIQQPRITQQEYAVAAELDAIVAPIGEAFALSNELRPDLLLTKNRTDDSHANSNGAYLRDLVIYSTLKRKTPADLAGEFNVSPEDETHLKNVAWQTVMTWNGIEPPPSPTAPPTSTATQVPEPSPTLTSTEVPPVLPTDTGEPPATGTPGEAFPTSPLAGEDITQAPAVPNQPTPPETDSTTPFYRAAAASALLSLFVVGLFLLLRRKRR